MSEAIISVPAESSMPTFTWQDLTEQLETIAATQVQRTAVPTLVSGIRKLAPFLPPAQVLKEILCLAWVIADEEFQPGFGEAPD